MAKKSTKQVKLTKDITPETAMIVSSVINGASIVASSLISRKKSDQKK